MPADDVKMLKSKKAQVYIFAALVLCVLVYSVYSESNKVSSSQKTKSEALCSEFEREYPRTVDYALESSQDVPQVLSDFETAFINYSRISERGLGLMYALSWKGRVYLKASFPEASAWEVIAYWNNSASLLNLSGDYNASAEGLESIKLEFSGTEYEMLPAKIPGLSFFCVSENEGNRQIILRNQ
jgi:hypothetical protein